MREVIRFWIGVALASLVVYTTSAHTTTKVPPTRAVAQTTR